MSIKHILAAVAAAAICLGAKADTEYIEIRTVNDLSSHGSRLTLCS